MKIITNALLRYRCALECLFGNLGFAALVFLYEARDRSTEEEEDYSFFQEG